MPQSARRAVVSSGLSLNVGLRAHGDLDIFRGVADTYDAAGKTQSALAGAVRAVEEWARSRAALDVPSAERLNSVREGWLAGVGLQTLSTLDTDVKIIAREFYGYELPWIIHAASQQLRAADEFDRADTLAEIALLVELGVSTALAARIFLAGVRSRAAATELATLDVTFGSTVAEISRKLRTSAFTDQLYPLVSSATSDWLQLMVDEVTRRRPDPVPEFPRFTVPDAGSVTLLHSRRLDGQVFLCTTDGQTRIPVEPTRELPFDMVANDPRVAFRATDLTWQLELRDPRLQDGG